MYVTEPMSDSLTRDCPQGKAKTLFEKNLAKAQWSNTRWVFLLRGVAPLRCNGLIGRAAEPPLTGAAPPYPR